MFHLPVLNENEEPITVFTDESGQSWIRRGHCCRCGDCCRCQYGDDPIYGICRHLDLSTTEGIPSCSNYGGIDYKKWGCGLFPQEPSDVAAFPRCTYYFEKVESKVLAIMQKSNIKEKL